MARTHAESAAVVRKGEGGCTIQWRAVQLWHKSAVGQSLSNVVDLAVFAAASSMHATIPN